MSNTNINLWRSFLFLTLIFASAKVYSQQWHWAISGQSEELDAPMKILPGKDGNVYVVGFFYAKVKFGSFELDSKDHRISQMYLLKINSCGEVIWAKQSTGMGSTTATDMIIDKDENIFITGDYINTVFFGDFQLRSDGVKSTFLAKYDKDGEVIWAKTIHDNTATSTRMSVSSDGYLNISAKGADLSDLTHYIFQVDTDGNETWRKKIKFSVQYRWAGDIMTDANNDIYYTGSFFNKIDFSDTILTSSENGMAHGFIVKYNSLGELLWTFDLAKKNDLNISQGTLLQSSPNGYFYLIASTFDLTRSVPGQQLWDGAMILKLNPNGNIERVDTIKSTFVYSIQEINNKEIIIAGNTMGQGVAIGGKWVNEDNTFIAKIGANGKSEWIKSQPTFYPNQILASDSNYIYSIGQFKNTLKFDSITLNGNISGNSFISRLTFFDEIPAPDDTICSGVDLILGNAPKENYSYSWSPITSLSNPLTANPVFNYVNNTDQTVTLKYILEIKNEICGKRFPLVDYDTILITVLPNYNDLKIISGSTTICPFSKGIKYWIDKKENFTYEWSVVGGEIVSGKNTDTLLVDWGGPDQTAMVQVKAINILNNCSETVALPIYIEELLKPDRPIGDTAFCLDKNIFHKYHTSFLNIGSKYYWKTDDSSAIMRLINEYSIEVAWSSPGQKKLWVLEESRIPCIGSSDTLLIDVHPLPDSSLSIDGPEVVGEYSRSVPYHINGSPSSTYQWEVTDDGEIIEGEGTERIYINWGKKGTYTIRVIETTKEGCLGMMIEKQIIVENLYIPNIITPNGDEYNQYFEIKQIEFYSENYLQLYDRYGKLVFKQQNYDNNWQAEGVPNGTYFYYFKTGKLAYKGWLQVLR